MWRLDPKVRAVCKWLSRLMTPTWRPTWCWPHVLEPVDWQQVCGHGEVELVNEGGAFGRRVKEVADGGPQLAQLGLQGGNSPQPWLVLLPLCPQAAAACTVLTHWCDCIILEGRVVLQLGAKRFPTREGEKRRLGGDLTNTFIPLFRPQP